MAHEFEVTPDKRLICKITKLMTKLDFLKFADSTINLNADDWEPGRGVLLGDKLGYFPPTNTGQLLAKLCHWVARHSTPRTTGNSTAYDVLKETENTFDDMVQKAKKAGAKSKHECALAYAWLRSNSSVLTVTHFRASVSKFFCDEYTYVNVLDCCAGWGDRLTGFLGSKSVKEIVLIEPRKDGCEGYEEQFKIVAEGVVSEDVRTHYVIKEDGTRIEIKQRILRGHVHGREVTLRIYNGRAEDVVLHLLETEKGKFDLAITSPPYFNTELYGEDDNDTAGQCHKTYEDEPNLWQQKFMNDILIDKVAELLAPQARLVLNIDGISICEPSIAHAAKNASLKVEGTYGLAKGSGHGKGVSKRPAQFEPIYVWQKPAAPIDRTQAGELQQRTEPHTPEHPESAAEEAAARVAAAPSCARKPPVPPVLETPAPSGSVAEAPRVSSGGTPSGLELEREVGTVLRVHWKEEGASYVGSVVKCNGGLSLVHYSSDGKKQWHDFDKDKCNVLEVLEPAAHAIATLRRTTAGYDAQVVSGGRWYAMTREYVDDQFESEKAWLEKLQVGGPFESLPIGAKRRRKAESVKSPYCVLGSLAKCLASTDDSKGAELVSDDVEASLTAKCRLKFAASRASAYGYQAVKVHGHALQFEAKYPTLLQVSRTHAVTVLHGLLFDSAQPKPLPLTPENLETCIGHPYSGDIVRGYQFEPLPKAVKRKLSMPEPASKRGRDV